MPYVVVFIVCVCMCVCVCVCVCVSAYVGSIFDPLVIFLLSFAFNDDKHAPNPPLWLFSSLAFFFFFFFCWCYCWLVFSASCSSLFVFCVLCFCCARLKRFSLLYVTLWNGAKCRELQRIMWPFNLNNLSQSIFAPMDTQCERVCVCVCASECTLCLSIGIFASVSACAVCRVYTSRTLARCLRSLTCSLSSPGFELLRCLSPASHNFYMHEKINT